VESLGETKNRFFLQAKKGGRWSSKKGKDKKRERRVPDRAREKKKGGKRGLLKKPASYFRVKKGGRKKKKRDAKLGGKAKTRSPDRTRKKRWVWKKREKKV